MSNSFVGLKIQDYLNTSFICGCGRKHKTTLKYVDISHGALERLHKAVSRAGFRRPLIICDDNTYNAAGKEIEESFEQNSIMFDMQVIAYSTGELVPDERAVGAIIMAVSPETDCIIAVGAGTINDLCKYASYKQNLPYYIVATAPSMDGFASIGAALVQDNLKVSFDAHIPYGIVGDLDILSKAPARLVSSGFCDIIGKYTCLTDWKLAHIVNDEYYCPEIVAMVEGALEEVCKNAAGVLKQDVEAIGQVMQALVLTGIAMSFVGNSRPASGSEHHLSHYWEMVFQMQGKPPVPHGTKVGIGTVISAYLYNLLRGYTFDEERAERWIESFNMRVWREKMEEAFSVAAQGVIELEEKSEKNSRQAHAKRLARYKACWGDIAALIENQPPLPEEIEAIINSVNSPTNPAAIKVSESLVQDSVMVAKEVRDRYTILQLLWDLGLMEEYAEKVVCFFKT